MVIKLISKFLVGSEVQLVRSMIKELEKQVYFFLVISFRFYPSFRIFLFLFKLVQHINTEANVYEICSLVYNFFF